jgi:hypothetical protein
MGTVFLAIRFVDEPAHPPSSPDRTSTPTQVPMLQGTVQPLFSDNFVNNKNGWSVVSVPGSGYTRTLQNNALTLADTEHNVLIESVPTSSTFKNFSITTTFTLMQADKNDSVGLYIRGDSNLDHDYRVDIFGNDTYAISKETLNANNELEQTFLIHPSRTNALKSIGQRNVLTIAMQGPTMTAQINGKTVHTLSDTAYTHGQIALFVENGPTSNGVTAIFHSLVIYPIPDQSPRKSDEASVRKNTISNLVVTCSRMYVQPPLSRKETGKGVRLVI